MGADYVQDDISGFDNAVAGHFVDVLHMLRRINKHSKGLLLVAEAQGYTIDGFLAQSTHQGLEAPIRNSRNSPGFGKLVAVAQAEIQRARVAIDAAGKKNYRVYWRGKIAIVQLRVLGASSLVLVQ